MYLPNHSATGRMHHRLAEYNYFEFKGFFLLEWWLTKVKQPCQPFYLPIVGERKDGSIRFERA